MSTPTVFGATIVGEKDEMSRPQPARTPAASQYSLDLTEAPELAPPRSPFYQHPPASHEKITKYGKSLDISVTEKGGDELLTPFTTKSNDPFCSSISVNANKECSMWPSRQTLVQNSMAEKKAKRSAAYGALAGPRHFWAKRSKKQKLTISLLIAMLVIGAMIGLGVGISKAVNGTYYSPSGAKST